MLYYNHFYILCYIYVCYSLLIFTGINVLNIEENILLKHTFP